MAIQGHEGARKQHDHDVHEEEVQKSIDFLKKNSKLILALMIVVLAGFVVLAIYNNYQKTIADRAGLQYHQAESADQLQEIVDSFPAADIAPMAQLNLSTRLYREGKYDEALAGYQKFLTAYADNELLAPGASLNIAFTQMARGELETALSEFDAFIAHHPDHFLFPYALLSKGLCLEQLSRFNDAKIHYEDFIAADHDENWNELANESLESLNRRLDSKS